MAYVYLHKRKDNNEIFYVGISDSSIAGYRRSKSKRRGKNQRWYEIANVYGFYPVIILDKISIEEACTIEKNLIEVYGRIFEGGILTNIASGGAFRPNFIPAYNRGLKMPESQHIKMIELSEKKKIKVAKYTLDGVINGTYDSVIEAARKNNLLQGNITHASKKKIMYGGYLWRYYEDAILTKIEPYLARVRKIEQFNLNGTFINEYESAIDAARKNGFQKSTILRALKRKNNIAYNFIWTYKK